MAFGVYGWFDGRWHLVSKATEKLTAIKDLGRARKTGAKVPGCGRIVAWGIGELVPGAKPVVRTLFREAGGSYAGPLPPDYHQPRLKPPAPPPVPPPPPVAILWPRPPAPPVATSPVAVPPVVHRAVPPARSRPIRKAVCAYCGNTFDAEHPTAKYCPGPAGGPKCRQAAFRKARARCGWCRTPFAPKQVTQAYCGVSCRTKFNNAKRG